MADISQYLQAIMQAVYGEDVRGSIHDAIELINDVSEVVLTTGTAVTSSSSSSTGFYVDSLYLNTNTMELWKCIGTDSWQSQGTFKGDPGEAGTDGVGISDISKTSSAGLVDTYTITYTDSSTDTFNVTNGEDGNKWYRGTAISGKDPNPTVFSGSGIAKANPNDFYLNATEGAVYHCVTGGNASTATWSYDFTMTGGGGGGGTSDYNELTNKPQINSVSLSGNKSASDLGLMPATTLAQVATSGSYSDLSNTPTIPTVTNTYSSTSDDAMSGKAVNAALGTLDGSISGSPGTGKTLSAFSQTDGVVSATFQNISITKSQVSDFPVIPTINDSNYLSVQQNGVEKAKYTGNQSTNTTANIETDEWTAEQTISTSDTSKTFTGLNSSYAYKPYIQVADGESPLPYTNMVFSGTSCTVTFDSPTAAQAAGNACKIKLRIVK